MRTFSSVASDDYASCSLDTGLWTFVDPIGDGSLAMTGSQLELSVPAGVAHDAWGANNTVRVVQVANDADFELEVKFESGVLAGNQLQGLLVEQDGDNYLRFDFYGDGSNTRIFAARIAGGSPSTQFNGTVTAGGTSPLYMRVSRSGTHGSLCEKVRAIGWISSTPAPPVSLIAANLCPSSRYS